MKKKRYVAIYVLSITLIIAFIVALIIKFHEKTQLKYKVSTEKTFQPYGRGIDIYNATENNLKKLDLVHYKKSYGYVDSEKTAFDIAKIVLIEVYEDCCKNETPFTVKYNKNAEAWIIHGSLPKGMLGGVASIGIKKDTGAILFIMHTK